MVAAPAQPASAQTTLMLGVGTTHPAGNYGEQADWGRHAKAALQLGVPAFPLSARFEGVYHNIPGSDGTGNSETLIAGKLGAVFTLGLPVGPGFHFLGGLGRYRSDKESAQTTLSHNGAHGGVGGRFRLLGIGVWAEVQVVNRFDVGSDSARHATVTAGLEF